jgi:hypothetical protein
MTSSSLASCKANHNEIVTGADGSADFGIPAKGRYDATFSAVGVSKAQVTIGGTVVPTQACWDFATGQTYDPTARAASSDRITFDADGIHPVIVNVVGAAKVKSHSNTNNNRMASPSC